MLDQSNLVDSISHPTNHKTQPPITEDKIRLVLEWAGARILSLPYTHLGPRSTRSSWPSIPTNYISPSLSLTITNHDIDLIDHIYEIINHIPSPTHRRIVQSRSLILPYSNRYLITWSRLGRLLNTNRRQVQQFHSSSLFTIKHSLTNNQINILSNINP